MLLFVTSSLISVPGTILNINKINAIPLIDEFVEAELKNKNITASSNQPVDNEPEFFVIQHTQSGSITSINATTYSLELIDVYEKTILFSDRLDRIVKSISTSDFIGNWSLGVNDFAIDPPNAVLIIDEQNKQDIVIMELFNPEYDINKKTLKYL